MKKAFLAESAVLTQVRNADLCKFGFPKADSIINGEESYEILFEALGKDLKRVMSKCAYKRFSVPTCFYIGIQLLDLLEKLHSINFVHNDIKMENIVIGKDDSHKIYLIDFGLS